jgi:hypothetical protein
LKNGLQDHPASVSQSSGHSICSSWC